LERMLLCVTQITLLKARALSKTESREMMTTTRKDPTLKK
jgi:hypothetical protein